MQRGTKRPPYHYISAIVVLNSCYFPYNQQIHPIPHEYQNQDTLSFDYNDSHITPPIIINMQIWTDPVRDKKKTIFENGF